MFNSIIIGLGKIGCGYDYNHQPDHYILTHAQAIKHHPSFRLIGGIDTSSNMRKKFENKFNAPTYDNIYEMNNIIDIDIDVVVVSVPTTDLYQIFNDVISTISPKLILLEKPLSLSSKNASTMLNSAKQKGIAVAVNYIREFEPFHISLIKKINNDEFGHPIKVLCWYGNDFITNGSHFIQFFSNFMGDYIEINFLDSLSKYKNTLFLPTFEILYPRGSAYFIPLGHDSYSLCEMEMIFPKGKIKYYQDGFYYDFWSVTDDVVFGGSKKLVNEPIRTKTNMHKYQYYVYENLFNYLTGSSDLFCDGKSALNTLYIIDQLNKHLS